MVDPASVVGRQAHRDARHRRDRARQPDQRPGLPDRDRLGDGGQGRVYVTGGGRYLVPGRRVPVQMPLGHPDTADVDGNRPHGTLIGPAAGHAEHELGRAAADVSDQEGAAVRGGQLGGRSGKRQRGFLRSGEDVRRDAEYLLDLTGELRRVARVPGGARRDHAHRARGAGRDDIGVVAQHAGRPGQRFRRQPAGPVDPLPQPDDLHQAHHVGQLGAGGIDVGDQQPERIGAAVHGGDTRHEGRPDTHGPARHHSPTASSASRPNGFTPPTASSWATSACRHFTRSGIPPAD